MKFSKKEAKGILKQHPHKWSYDKFGIDLICEVCNSNMEGMENEVIKFPISDFFEKFNNKAINNRLKLQKKYKNVIFPNGDILVPKSWFNEIVITEDPEWGITKRRIYNFPKEYVIKCPHCSELRKVFSYSLYTPWWYNIAEFFRTDLYIKFQHLKFYFAYERKAIKMLKAQKKVLKIFLKNNIIF